MAKSKKDIKPKEKKERGRPKAIESPEVMFNLFKEYRNEIKSKPILVQDFVGKDAYEVKRERERLGGFCFVCFQ